MDVFSTGAHAGHRLFKWEGQSVSAQGTKENQYNRNSGTAAGPDNEAYGKTKSHYSSTETVQAE